MTNELNRREALWRLIKLGGTAALTAGVYGALYGREAVSARARISQGRTDFRVPGAPEELVVARGRGKVSPALLVKKAVERLGGMEKFISRGDVVAVKPNMSWDRPPELAATTNPEVTAAVAQMCLDAGASRVNLVDNTINNARRCFISTGMEKAARASGARLIKPSADLFKTMDLGGRRLGPWKVYTPIIEADKLINLPVAKTHGLTGLTLGMKNWIGAVGGRRGALHQDIHQSIVDLARFFRPTLVIIDAVRIMVRSGPSGGRLSDVLVKNTIIAGTDQVAADAAAASLFGLGPGEIGYILLSERQGLGRINPGPDKVVEVTV